MGDIARDICTDSFYIVNSGLPCIAVIAVIYKYTNIQKYKYTNIQIYKYTNIQIYKYTNIQIYKYKNIQIYKYTNIQIDENAPFCAIFFRKRLCAAQDLRK